MRSLTGSLSFIDEGAKAAAANGAVSAREVTGMMKFLDLVRDVADGTATVLRMSINAEVLDSSGEPCQLNRSDAFRLQTLCLVSQEMLEERAQMLMRDINASLQGQSARQGEAE